MTHSGGQAPTLPATMIKEIILQRVTIQNHNHKKSFTKSSLRPRADYEEEENFILKQ